MSHLIGGFFKYLAALLIFVFSVSLSYTFFSSIAPRNMPWFTGAALGLTEFGLICWLAVFMLQKHHDAHKSLAFVMIFVCLIAVIFTDAMELARLFGSTFFLAGLYFYGLIVLFCAHMLALVIDFFIGYFEKVSFHGGQPPTQRIREPQPKHEDTGETERPLEQMSFAQNATVKLPTLPFMNRMSAAIRAFQASGNQQPPTCQPEVSNQQQSQNQPVQQEPEAPTQSQSDN